MPEDDAGPEAAPIVDPMRFGENSRALRRLQRITQSELAARAKVTLTTVYSVEKGVRVRLSTLRKIAAGLNTDFDALAYRDVRVKTPERAFVVHRNDEAVWFAVQDRRRNIPENNWDRIQNPGERLRLGRLGLVRGFTTLPNFVMKNGPGLTLVELFGVVEGNLNATIYRDCVMYCLRGPVIVTVQGERVYLEEGEVIGLSTADLDRMEPALPYTGEDPPPLMLWVGAGRIGQVPG